MEEQLDRIENKIDKLDDRVNRIDITLARLTTTVEVHERRSTTLEAQVKPLEEHMSMIHGTLKFITLVALVLGIIATIKGLF
tara:strand:- start:449 stop:694 length:246 start_codon:yes stop_codon:yes gene_type:complete